MPEQAGAAPNSPMQYLDSALTALRDLGLSPGEAGQDPIVPLLDEITGLDEARVVAIARTLTQASFFNEVVREQVAAMQIGERYQEITRAFDGIRDDAKALVDQISDGAIDTVERIQGQEREVVIVSLAAGDPAESKQRGAFHLSLNRLNVALSRARTKAVLVGSRHAFAALPSDPEGLRMASRCKELRDRMPCVDLTKLYVVAGAQ